MDPKYENGWNPTQPTNHLKPLSTISMPQASVCIHNIGMDTACTECNLLFNANLFLISKHHLQDFKKLNPHATLFTSSISRDTYAGFQRLRAYSGRMMEHSVLKYEDEHKRDLQIILTRCLHDLEEKLGYIRNELEKLK